MKTAQKFLVEMGITNTRLTPNYSLSDALEQYALEAIKHDREKVSDFAASNQDLTKSELKQAIINLPIELK